MFLRRPVNMSDLTDLKTNSFHRPAELEFLGLQEFVFKNKCSLVILMDGHWDPG